MSYSQYNNNDIGNSILYMGYPDLVKLLAKNITPEIRSLVLDRLTLMNNQILSQQPQQNNQQGGYQPVSQSLDRNYSNQFDSFRPVTSNYRKKDVVELPHPSTDQYARGNTNYSIQSTSQEVRQNESIVNRGSYPKNNVPQQKPRNAPVKKVDIKPTIEFDLDDILDSIDRTEEEDDMDKRLKKLGMIQQKIMTNNERRKEKISK